MRVAGVTERSGSACGAECQTLPELLQLRAERSPDTVAFTFLRDGVADEESLTYRSLDQRARRLAALLASEQAPGARALLLLPPGLEFLSAFFACAHAGLVAV